MEIKLKTIQVLTSRRLGEIKRGMDYVMKLYRSRGFVIDRILGNNEFQSNKLTEHVLPTILDTCAAREHVEDIERRIRTLKEKSRSVYHGCPFSQIPKLMTV